MSSIMLNVLFVIAIVVLVCMLIREGMDHAETYSDLQDAQEAWGIAQITLDRYRREKIEAQAIADHAINVIAEAREITRHTIREARLAELAKAFIDRRQREQDAKDLQDEIDKLTGDTK